MCLLHFKFRLHCPHAAWPYRSYIFAHMFTKLQAATFTTHIIALFVSETNMHNKLDVCQIMRAMYGVCMHIYVIHLMSLASNMQQEALDIKYITEQTWLPQYKKKLTQPAY